MTIEDGHFRTDGETIEPCCESQKWMIDNTLYFRLMYCGRIVVPNRKYFLENIPKRKMTCQYCGAKLEYVDKLDGE